MTTSSRAKPYSIMRLHETCCNFAILQQTPDYDLYYRCNFCDLNLQPTETISMEEYIAREQGEQQPAASSDLKSREAFLPYQIVTFSKKKELETPVVASEFIVFDKTNHRETFFCPSCRCDKPMILLPNKLKDLSFKRICETCRTIT